MGNVISIAAKKPHLSGEAVCLLCQHIWAAVAETGTVSLQCPECGTNKGVLKNLCSPAGSLVFTCDCDNDLFNVTKNGVFCIKCGTLTTYSQLCD